MTFSGNSGGASGAGGAIYNSGNLTVTASTFSGNAVASSGAGGAIFNGDGTASIANSTFFQNTTGSAGFGGAIFSNGGTVTVNSATFSANGVGAGGQGGAIFVSSSGSVQLENTILAGSTGGNCAGVVENGAYNISDDGTCGFGSSTIGVNGATLGDNVNPGLNSNGLQNNGGPTQTIALVPGSPALDAIPEALCLSTDQRGAARPDPLDLASANPACDVGAKESGNFLTVNTLEDDATAGDGLCSLRKAINNVNTKGDTTGGDCAAGSGSDTILFSISGAITLGSPLPAIAKGVAIMGSGQTILGSGVFVVQSGSVLELSNLFLSGGGVSDGGDVNNAGILIVSGSALSSTDSRGCGGAIYNSGVMTITNSILSGNNNSPAGDQVFPLEGGGVCNVGTATITNSTISDNITVGGFGAGIYNIGTLNIIGTSLSGNVAGSPDGVADALGGGIYNIGVLNVTGSTFSGNRADFNGGGIFDGGTLTVASSTFSGNSSQGGFCMLGPCAGIGGGGIYSSGGLSVTDSTFANNLSLNGGGIYYSGTAAIITNSTFSSNNAQSGNAIFAGGNVIISDSTIAGNNMQEFTSGAGGAVASGSGSTITFINSIVSGNVTNGGNCVGQIILTNGYNISDDATCDLGMFIGANGQVLGDNIDPLLDPDGLQNNGGPTLTIGLQPDSPAIAAVPLGDCTIATDQRGAPRPAPGKSACDIGAFELGSTVPVSTQTVTATPTATPTATTATATATSTQTATGGATRTGTATATATTTASRTATATLSPTTTATSTATMTATPTATATTELSASPGTRNFGNVDASGVSKPKKLTLTNKGKVAAVISTVSVSAPFVIGGGANTCSGKTIALKKTCSFDIEFAPPIPTGNVTGSIEVTYNGLSPIVALKGNGIQVRLKAPISVSFTAVTAGKVGKLKNVVFLSPNTVPVTVGLAALSGSDPGSFRILNNQCSAPPMGKCAIQIEFAPPVNANGTQSATLTVEMFNGDKDTGGGYQTQLSGKVK